ncbi:MAG TPA: cation transporting ATPase C-terminal domain-containing protein, partial [Rhodocyclaceae bacterium]|nr:cation transporting ATPase C-terminal domain-containing protein [Rhodocyclaceae bacterium]
AVEAAYLFNCRSLTRGLRLRGLFANPWLWAGLGLTGILQGLMTYWPPLQSMFQTAAIGPADWLRIGAWAVCAVLAVELEKALVALWRRKQ